MSTVLWGGRKGDIQYNSRDYWRRNIPIRPGVASVTVEASGYFDVGDRVAIGAELLTVVGKATRTLGVAP